jgi:catechol 2,3-dioxygenase-like lactoylglutathione lyase family enzyme
MEYVISTDPAERAPVAEFECGHATFELIDCNAFDIKFLPNTNPVALHVDDFDAAYDELKSRGVNFKHTLDSGVCRMVFFEDPDGNVLLIHHRYAPDPTVR